MDCKSIIIASGLQIPKSAIPKSAGAYREKPKENSMDKEQIPDAEVPAAAGALE